jgi:hypothetical protein
MAFPFFSGAAGGIVFSIMMMAVIAIAALVFEIWSESVFVRSRFFSPTRDRYVELTYEAAGQAFLYAYCYCLTALFVHRLFMPRLKSSLTWVVLLCLFAFGMVLPYILLLLMRYDRWDIHSHSRWLLTNPFHAIYQTTNADQAWIHLESRLFYWCFLIIWTAAATLFNVRWLWSQFGQFRRAEGAPPPPTAALPGESTP